MRIKPPPALGAPRRRAGMMQRTGERAIVLVCGGRGTDLAVGVASYAADYAEAAGGKLLQDRVSGDICEKQRLGSRNGGGGEAM